METLKIHYHRNESELCHIGKKYDTDKSSQRENVSDQRHCHPYTLFYDSLFRGKRQDHLKIAELGILHGASLRMWQEYFPHSDIYGFEYHASLIDKFRTSYNQDRITLLPMNIHDRGSIVGALTQAETLFDIIIEDTTHQFEDQIRAIESSLAFLKPGGILIIEDIFRSYSEKNYFDRLQPILHHFQDYYFVDLDHVNRVSTGWDNDKLFVLVKAGAEPIFQNQNKITIITPSYRTKNLLEIEKTIQFDYVDEWIIVYDETKVPENPQLFSNPKIKEYVFTGPGKSGNPQRNFALTRVSNPHTMIYYLDDDNIIHPHFYSLLKIMENDKIYTFDQVNRIKGNRIEPNHIDTAMFIVPYPLFSDVSWIPHHYGADGFYIKECYQRNKNIHIYVNNDLCYYNKVK
jgi:predicted O-methyltransferase YrrM